MSTYALADSQTQWFQDDYPGATLNLSPETMVLTLHTTEGTGWDSYDGGAKAPNYTGMPPIGAKPGKWRVHFPDEKSSRALVNSSGGVETNTLNTVQVELIGTCDPKHAKVWGTMIAGKDYVYWPEASRAQLNWLAKFVADMHKRHGLKLEAPKPFKEYPGSYGTFNGVRMTFDEWRHAAGIVGHQHIPENVHGDPGNININLVLQFARQIVGEGYQVNPVPAPKSSGPGAKVQSAIDDLESAKKGKGLRRKSINNALSWLNKLSKK